MLIEALHLLSLPGLLLVIGLEIWLLKKKKKLEETYHYEETITNISVGIGERVSHILLAGVFFGIYDWIYEYLAPIHFPLDWWVWVGGFFLTDFLWYWYHRLGHEVNILWSAHVVHHSSTDYNFTVTARITVFQHVIRLGFWAVLPFVGFPPEMVFTYLVILGTYQFFMHTQLYNGFNKWLDYFLVTPSYHRVHHASNEIYLDKNYGGVLIIWDRLFGTFHSETELPKFGITEPIKSNSFLWVHFHYLLHILTQIKERITSPIYWKIILFNKPGAYKEEKEIRQNWIKQIEGNIKHNKALKYYINTQLVISLTLVSILFAFDWNYLSKFLISSCIIITLIHCGSILEKKKWCVKLEYVRLVLIILTVGYWVNTPLYWISSSH